MTQIEKIKSEATEKGTKAKKAYKTSLKLLLTFLVDIVILVILGRFLFSIFVWFVAVFYFTGIILSIRVAVGDKNYDSKITWIIFLLTLAPLSVVLYFMGGELASKPLRSLRMKKIDDRTKIFEKAKISENLSARVKQDCNYIQNTTDYIAYYNSSCEYFKTGEDFYEDVLTKLKTAEKFIFIDFFILKEGRLADAVFEILLEKVEKGVDIRIVGDGLGSFGIFKSANLRRLRKLGIKIIPFERVAFFRNSVLANYRNHRKIIIIDGNLGYVCGANLADEYINAKTKFGLWKDAGMRIDGEAVNSLTLIFLRMWEYSSKETVDYTKFIYSTEMAVKNSNSVIVPYAGGPEQKLKICKDVYYNIVSNAKEKLYIMTPYFIVGRDLIDMLKKKAQSGVDVRIIIPCTPDKNFVFSLTLENAKSMISSGVKVYRYTPGFLHSKVIFSDDECAVVGSVNLDFRSFYQQYEVAAYIAGKHTALKTIATDFETTFEQSELITNIKKRNVFVRSWFAFLRLFAPLM
ncbi:MAG: cardiolipin synthase [Erysipelotrichales bacterium]|nr:cardiolipin synthase [Erysipelotrichales bacterium]